MLIALLLILSSAAAEKAAEINDACVFSAKGASRKELKTLTDDSYKTYFAVRAGGEISIDGK